MSPKLLPAPDLKQDGQSYSLERVSTLLSKRERISGVRRDRANVTKLHDMLADPETGEADLRWQVLIPRLDNGQTEAVISALESEEGFRAILEAAEKTLSTGQIAGLAALYEPDMFIPPALAKAAEQEKVDLTIVKFTKGHKLLRRSELLGLEYETYTDLSKLSEDKLRLAADFYRLYSARWDNEDYGAMPKEMVKLAFHDGYDMNDVVTVVRETGSSDPAVIRGVLEGVAAPVAEGWL